MCGTSSKVLSILPHLMAYALVVGLIGSKNLPQIALSITSVQLVLWAKQKESDKVFMTMNSLFNAICVDGLASIFRKKLGSIIFL